MSNKQGFPFPLRRWLMGYDGLGGWTQIVFKSENEARAAAAQHYPKCCPVDEYVHITELEATLAAKDAEIARIREALRKHYLIYGYEKSHYLKSTLEEFFKERF